MKNQPLNILLLGPPGSGKGTQALKLVGEFNLKYISTGDFARQIAGEKSEEGERVRRALAEGKLVPNEIIDNYVEGELSKLKTYEGVIFDGYPRDLEQALNLEKFLSKFGRKKILVIYLDVSEGNIIKRLLKRKRSDDKPSIIKKRIEEYIKKTKSVLKYFRDKEILKEVDGNGSIEEVYKKILKVIDYD